MSAILSGECKKCKESFYMSLGHPSWFKKEGKSKDPEENEMFNGYMEVLKSKLCLKCYIKKILEKPQTINLFVATLLNGLVD